MKDPLASKPACSHRSARRLALWALAFACWADPCFADDGPATRRLEAAAPTRIIVLAPNAAEIICGLGACDALVGISSFCTFPPELEHVPKIGGLRDPDLETIVGLKPDLMVLRGVSDPVRRLCDERHIPIYDDQVETLDDLYRTIADLGRLIHRQEQAEAMTKEIKDSLARVAERVSRKTRPRVLFTLRSPTALSSVLSTGRNTFISELIEIAGGENVFGDMDIRYPSVSLEEIVGRDPEIIIEAMTSDKIDDDRRATLVEQWQALAPISAVKQGRLHFITDGYFTIPSQRVVLTANALVEMIHPELGKGE